LSSNAAALRPLLSNLQDDLSALIENLEDPEFLTDFIAGGNIGRSRIPGKHGGASRSYTYLPVVIEDKPGQLAALFEECAEAGVNVEDLTIEHSPEQFTGLITLALSSDDAVKLFSHLEGNGWKVHAPRK
jgi:prephenate dehydrogenase